MTILSQSFLTLMRRNLMTLTLFTTRHTQIFFVVKKINSKFSLSYRPLPDLLTGPGLFF
jgi:hypothetical protein